MPHDNESKSTNLREAFLLIVSSSAQVVVLLPSSPHELDVSKEPEKENYKKGERVMLRVQSVTGAGFYVWYIDGHGQRAIETRVPELGVALMEKSNLSKDPVEVGLEGVPERVDLKVTVSAYDNHYRRRLLAQGKSEFTAITP